MDDFDCIVLSKHYITINLQKVLFSGQVTNFITTLSEPKKTIRLMEFSKSNVRKVRSFPLLPNDQKKTCSHA